MPIPIMILVIEIKFNSSSQKYRIARIAKVTYPTIRKTKADDIISVVIKITIKNTIPHDKPNDSATSASKILNYSKKR